MQFCGIICEFNPFHNGHKYLIEQAKKLTNSNIVCLMSGNFVQRGEPAFLEKYLRAKTAIENGADIVLELPTIFACSNAENFAFGAIKILNALGVKQLAFGIEDTSLDILQKIAEIKYNNSISFQNSFRNEVENGINFNTALKRAIAKEFGDNQILEILAKPNNILAIEYLTAIKKLDSKIKVVAINRVDNGYNSITAQNQFLSASGIREKISHNEDVSQFVPYQIHLNNIFDKYCQTRFESLALHTIRTLSAKELEKFYDYNEGIEYRIKSLSNDYSNLEQLTKQISTPRYRESRVNKLLIYPLIGITKAKSNLAKKVKPFAKVLAISKSQKHILSAYPKSKINLIVTNKDYESPSASQKKIIEIDLHASNIYNLAISKQNNNDKKTGTLFL